MRLVYFPPSFCWRWWKWKNSEIKSKTWYFDTGWFAATFLRLSFSFRKFWFVQCPLPNFGKVGLSSDDVIVVNKRRDSDRNNVQSIFYSLSRWFEYFPNSAAVLHPMQYTTICRNKRKELGKSKITIFIYA